MSGTTASRSSSSSSGGRVGGELLVVLALVAWSRQPTFVAVVAVVALPGLRHVAATLVRRGLGVGATAAGAVLALWWPGGAWPLVVVAASGALGAARLVREGRPTGRAPLPAADPSVEAVSGERRRTS